MKKPSFIIEPYTNEEKEKIEKTFLNTESYAKNLGGHFIRMRDLYIFRIAFLLGTRPCETLYLTWSSIDFERNEININPYTNKERNPESIILSENAKKLLLQWKEFSSKFIYCDYIFPSLNTFEPITTDAYRKRLQQVSKEAGVLKVIWYTENGQPIHNKRFYSTRKTYGHKIWEMSGDPHLLKRLLRHKNMNHQDKYVFPSKEIIKYKLDRIM
jgi:integrase